ncbi:MAG: alpha-amylase family glycosyl hydrolase, partial [Candidatus Nanohalobium sp.]
EMPRKYLQALTGSQELVQRNYIGLLDGVLDFKSREIVLSILGNSFVPDVFAKYFLKLHYSHYPEDFSLPNFLDNHDTNRALFELGNDKERLKKAFNLLNDQDQPTVIYYGTEIGMTQHHGMSEFPSHGDLQARKPMRWDDKDEELLEFFRRELNNPDF